MKAVVMECQDGRSVILKEDGTFCTIDEVHPVGESIEYKENITEYTMKVPEDKKNTPVGKENTLEGKEHIVRFPMRAVRRTAVAMAAAVLLAFTGAYGYQNTMAYASVTIGGEQSITCVLNRKNEVIQVKAEGADADAILEEAQSQITGRMSMEEAVVVAAQILAEADDANYAESGGDGLTVTVETRNAETKEKLSEKAEKSLEKSAAAVDSVNGTKETGGDKNSAFEIESGSGAANRNEEQNEAQDNRSGNNSAGGDSGNDKDNPANDANDPSEVSPGKEASEKETSGDKTSGKEEDPGSEDQGDGRIDGEERNLGSDTMKQQDIGANQSGSQISQPGSQTDRAVD